MHPTVPRVTPPNSPAEPAGATSDAVDGMLQHLRQTSAPPDGACQRLTVPIDGLEVSLIRSTSRNFVRTSADELLADVDQFQNGVPGASHISARP